MIEQEEIVIRRREIVRHWWHIGTAPSVILDRLSAHDEYSFLDPTLSFKKKIAVIEDDIANIKATLDKAFDVSNIDANAAHSTYLARTEYHYQVAMQQGNIELAQKLNKDLARAQGVKTEEAIQIGGDIFSIMTKAIAAGREKKSPAIDVTPEEQPALPPPESHVPTETIREEDSDEPRKKPAMPAFSILGKKPSIH